MTRLARRVRRLLAATAGVGLTATAAVGITAPTAAAAPLPNSMAALGDSITMGFNTCGWFRDCPKNSWSTGDNAEVNSHYLRIRAKNPAIAGKAYNNGKSGAEVSALVDQAKKAVSQRVEYVTILIGANDACADTESQMTSVSDFEQRFRAAMGTLRDGLSSPSVQVSSVPDLKRLWQVLKDDPDARGTWSFGKICQTMLANPTSTAAADVARRDRVRQRVADYNGVLSRVCGEFAGCRFDGNAVFNYPFLPKHVTTWDYFHPNTKGEAVLAEQTYRATFDW